MPNQVVRVERANLAAVIDRICTYPTYIFSVVCRRRTPLYDRYEPIDIETNGKEIHYGDRTCIADRQFVQGSRRVADKVLLQDVGTLRKMIVKGKPNMALPTKHWRPKGGRLAYNPAEHGLKLVAGIYRDAPTDQGACNGRKRIGRNGQWRPFAMICLRTTEVLTHAGIDYVVA